MRYVSLCFKPHCFRPFDKRPFAKQPFGPIRKRACNMFLSGCQLVVVCLCVSILCRYTFLFRERRRFFRVELTSQGLVPVFSLAQAHIGLFVNLISLTSSIQLFKSSQYIYCSAVLPRRIDLTSLGLAPALFQLSCWFGVLLTVIVVFVFLLLCCFVCCQFIVTYGYYDLCSMCLFYVYVC